MDDDFTELESLPTRKKKMSSHKRVQENFKSGVWFNLQNDADLVKELLSLAVIAFIINHPKLGVAIAQILPNVIKGFIVPENSNFLSSAIKAILIAVTFYIVRLLFLSS